MKTWIANPDIYHNLGELIIDAQDSHSLLTQYFIRLKAEATKPENDRIHYALEWVVDYFNRNGVVSSPGRP